MVRQFKHRRRRTPAAFSLMEVIVATAVLAASGAALFGLIGQASQLASKAQLRTEALQVAAAVMNEATAVRGMLAEGETTAIYESQPTWQYRLVSEPVENESLESSAGAEVTTTLVRVVVEVFPAPDGSRGANGSAALGGEGQPTVRLVRLARVQRNADGDVGLGTSAEPLPPTPDVEGSL